jgi:hypothetical protein
MNLAQSCLLKVLGQQRFSTREAHLGYAQPGHADSHQPDNLV